MTDLETIITGLVSPHDVISIGSLNFEIESYRINIPGRGLPVIVSLLSNHRIAVYNTGMPHIFDIEDFAWVERLKSL